MNSSFRIGSLFGITVRVHVLLLVMVAMVVASRGLEGLLLVSVLLGVVLLHELGHGLVAQSFGIRVVDITFWPLGGLARMTRIPEDARTEGLIAFAGPAVNFALAALTLPIHLLTLAGPDVVHRLAQSFIAVNLVLAVFNLLPAFPLDGARVLRAWLARRGDWLAATERTVAVGRYVAVAIALLGSLVLPMPFGCVLWFFFAGWLWVSGTMELASVRARRGADPLADLVGAIFGSRARRPPLSETAEAPGGGFSAEEIAELERFRGSWRSRRDEG